MIREERFEIISLMTADFCDQLCNKSTAGSCEGYSLKLNATYDGIHICQGYAVAGSMFYPAIPDGFVISSQTSGSACGSGSTLVLSSTTPGVGHPTAAFSISSLVAGLPVDFDASQSKDPNNLSLTYKWNFGDGVTVTTSSPMVSHVYAQPGVYTVVLIVNNGNTASSPATQFVEIRPNLSWLIPIIAGLLN